MVELVLGQVGRCLIETAPCGYDPVLTGIHPCAPLHLGVFSNQQIRHKPHVIEIEKHIKVGIIEYFYQK